MSLALNRQIWVKAQAGAAGCDASGPSLKMSSNVSDGMSCLVCRSTGIAAGLVQGGDEFGV